MGHERYKNNVKRKKERKKVDPSGDWTHGPHFQCSIAYLNTLQSGGNALGW
jgi:hypothetical protein